MAQASRGVQMAIELTVRDETAVGEAYNEIPLVFPSERITVRDLIRERVYQEVQDFNRTRDAEVFRGLVQPNDTERTLNGARAEFRFKGRRQIDWKDQYEKALGGFQANGFLILVNDHQVEDLDEVLILGPGSQVAFVKLTLLVGG
ncbi:hypothetical protein [Botrimarina mediterranea]|uniref:Uncharacterized protein n=1 Tax=Botrimarina mediterranea TaxID=2528022 RepID=A0A518K7U8_9BACT|nr:hypothetical protein [Botrimarina mediterranea]QDV73847.1 hypothetical protein Spa11_20460 [Botrimarina mediterranea]QDV78477.1 hypothetical protein K2D_20840 [Planctomycetes bacterium K2D]